MKMRKNSLFVVAGVVIFLLMTACSSSMLDDSQYTESEINMLDNAKTAASSGEYVRLMYASYISSNQYVIKARRGQPFGGPNDGEVIVFYKEKSTSWWKSKVMTKAGSDYDYYTTSITTTENIVDFFICLNVYNQYFYDHYPSNPYKIGNGFEDSDYPGAIVGNDISFIFGKIDEIPIIGTNAVRYRLLGYFYSSYEPSSGFVINVGYKDKNGTSILFPAVKTITLNNSIHQYFYCKTIGYGAAGDTPPTFEVWASLNKNGSVVAVDDFFGKNYSVTVGKFTK